MIVVGFQEIILVSQTKIFSECDNRKKKKKFYLQISAIFYSEGISKRALFAGLYTSTLLEIGGCNMNLKIFT
jgi:hypothetical protein